MAEKNFAIIIKFIGNFFRDRKFKEKKIMQNENFVIHIIFSHNCPFCDDSIIYSNKHE